MRNGSSVYQKAQSRKVVHISHLKSLTVVKWQQWNKKSLSLVTEVEAILNVGSFTYVFLNIEDCQHLTPFHLMYSIGLTLVPYSFVDEDKLADP